MGKLTGGRPNPADADAEADDGEDETNTDQAADTARLGIRALTSPQLIALRRAGWSDEDIEDVRSDAELIRHAEREAKNEARNKAAYEASRPKPAPADTGRQAEAQPRTTEGKFAPKTEGAPVLSPAPEPDFVDLPQPVIEELELTRDAAKALTKWQRDNLAAVRRQMAETVQAYEARLAELTETVNKQGEASYAQGEEREIASVRDGLREAHPEVATEGVWSRILGRARELAPGYVHREDRVRALLRDATILELGHPKAKPKRAAANPDTAPPAKPTPPVPRPTAKKTAPKPQTPEQQTQANLDASLAKWGIKRRQSRW